MKWYISAFIALVSLFVVEQHSKEAPNQEIVVSFDSLSDHQSQETKSFITSQLTQLGAENIVVVINENEQLIITYYSELPVYDIKSSLFTIADDEELVNDLRIKESDQSIPSDENAVDYQIDIYEINEQLSSGMDDDGKSYFEIKQDFSRGSQVHFSFLQVSSLHKHDYLFATTCRVSSEVHLSLNAISFQIPEVRAGPIS
ncbi:hypothetical protein LX97_00242 [Nonlabens dokdonensis]|jgi:hypothetical protein|uniref:Uncharacterized protein n=2 Tax=Nonlabens dokdonensis TaxID=328515 RepID=L7W9I5_NONDD|nr:hypothetical protein [Nonlabens dokdonensis]AGC75548.1 hypothetical protein DDD_0421 [Nonlabens dokdonensis DSW-6]PZX43242.1 hypothetical protein LX97_00242 [Nonlabens dokdonensis]